MSDADPMDVVEATNAVRGVTLLVRAFYDGLMEEGFTTVESMSLTQAYIVGLAGGRV